MNPLLKFFQESFQRLKQESPKFFKIITLINYIILLIAGIPEFLQYMDIVIYGKPLMIVNKIVAWAALYGAIISKLTVASPENLPFTKGTDNASDEPQP